MKILSVIDTGMLNFNKSKLYNIYENNVDLKTACLCQIFFFVHEPIVGTKCTDLSLTLRRRLILKNKQIQSTITVLYSSKFPLLGKTPGGKTPVGKMPRWENAGWENA